MPRPTYDLHAGTSRVGDAARTHGTPPEASELRALAAREVGHEQPDLVDLAVSAGARAAPGAHARRVVLDNW